MLSPTTVATLLTSAITQGLPRIDAQMLMLHACGHQGHKRAWLIAHSDEQLNADQLAAWHAAVQRRLTGEPIAYIVGYKEFFGLRLAISPAVLDPRDDTETLVDWALELMPSTQSCKVLDLGTGSGAVALAIAKQRPLAQVTATDASYEALAVARSNAQAHQLAPRFVQADAHHPDWFSQLKGEVFDLIVSNPPYIAQADAHLAALRHEPAMALISGEDGLDAIRSIITHAARHLSEGGHLLLEHGYDQAQAVCRLLASHGFANATTRQDLAGVDRCSGAQLGTFG